MGSNTGEYLLKSLSVFIMLIDAVYCQAHLFKILTKSIIILIVNIPILCTNLQPCNIQTQPFLMYQGGHKACFSREMPWV